MEGLAIAFVTCDKYEFIWDRWYEGFSKYWKVDLPVYFCGEEKECPWDFTQIPHESVPVELWTTKLRNQVKQIPEEDIFLLMDDLIIQQDISFEFEYFYNYFLMVDADSFRIMGRDSASRSDVVLKILGGTINKIRPTSSYLISYSPVIIRKDFLLECLQWDESPWDNELKGSIRIRPLMKDIYSFHIDGWYKNAVIKGHEVS